MSAIQVAPTITASTRKLPIAASTPATAASIDALPRSRRGSSAFGSEVWLVTGLENSNTDVSRQVESVSHPRSTRWGDTLLGALIRSPGNGRARHPALIFQAEAGEWALFEAWGLNRIAAGLAAPVAALLQPLEGRIDLPELSVDLLEDGGVLLVLEDLRADVARVLVVVGQLADAGEIRRRLGVSQQVAAHAEQALALRFEPRTDLALVHRPLLAMLDLECVGTP